MNGNGKVTTAEAAEILGLSTARVLQLGREGRLASVKPDTGYSYLWAREEIEQLAELRRGDRCGCGMVEDVQAGLCWLCRLEERQPWHKRAPAVYAPAVRRGRLLGQGGPGG